MNRLTAFLCLGLLVLLPAIAKAEGVLVLKTASEVEGASIRLSDVFSGIPPESDRPIATAPAPGKSVAYDVNVLKKLAINYQLDWQPESLADKAVLTRASTRITQEMIEAAVLAKIDAQNVKGTKEILFDNKALEVNLPAGRAPTFALNNFDYDAQSKRFRAQLLAETGSAPLLVPVTGKVVVKRDIPVLTRRLERGVTIGQDDLDWIKVAEDRLGNDVVTDSKHLVGLELRHDLQEGQPIHARDVVQPRLVTRGSLVIMRIQTPLMTITAQGRALQDGTAGEVVRVTNTQSNRTVEGTVDSAGIVRIQTAQKLTLAQAKE